MIEVSTAKVSITPNEPCYLCGHAMRTELSKGVKDELECTALVLKVGSQTVVWESLELTILDQELSDEIRRQIGMQYNIPKQNIIISFVHTHSGPEVTESSIFSKDPSKGARPGYRDYLLKQSLNAVAACYKKGFTFGKVMARTLMIDGYYGNRNGKELVCDKSISLFRFISENNQTVGGIVNMTCHPTVLGPTNLELSGDLFGYIKRRIGNKWGVNPLMMQGAAGDMSNRCYREGDDYKELIRTAEGILDQIFLDESEEEIYLDKIVIEPYHYSLSYDPDIEKWRLELFEAAQKLKTETNFDKRKLLMSGISVLEYKVKKTHVTVEFDASIIRLGDLEICQIPAELFSCFGLQIKAASKAKYKVIWGYSNYSIGYLVERSQYGKTFESMVSDVLIGEPERITRELAELMAGNPKKLLRAATATDIITPQCNMYLCGYFPSKMSTGIHDDLYMTAIMLEVDGKKTIWFNLDICVMAEEIYSGIVQSVQKVIPILKENIIINTTHNHTGPLLFAFADNITDEESLQQQKKYLEMLCKMAENITAACLKKLEPVNVYLGNTQIEGFYSNRNSLDKPVDKTATIIRFIGENQKLVAEWINLSCHSTVLGPETTKYSADLLGNICKNIENVTGVYPLSTNGCSGDTSTRLYRRGNDFEELTRVVTGIMEQILAIHTWNYLYIDKFQIEDIFHHVEYDMDYEQLIREQDKAREQLKNTDNYDMIKILNSIITSIDMKKKESHVKIDLLAHLIHMGDLEWCTFPGELVAKLGLTIINSESKKHHLIATYVNEYIGYIVEEEEYGKNYESLSSLIPKGDPEILISKVMERL